MCPINRLNRTSDRRRPSVLSTAALFLGTVSGSSERRPGRDSSFYLPAETPRQHRPEPHATRTARNGQGTGIFLETALSLLTLGLLFANPVAARTIHVPADQPSISQGLAAATYADTVLVAPGVYKGEENRNLDTGSTQLVLRSEAGASTTVINCEHKGQAFVFNRRTSNRLQIEGFSIINGKSSNGGAIKMTGASPTFADCIFRGNEARATGGDQRGGALWLTDKSAPIFYRCQFINNHAEGSGGALYCNDSARPSFNSCIFTSNDGYSGGAAHVVGAYPKFINSVFTLNQSKSRGGAIHCEWNGNFKAVNCTFFDNGVSAVGCVASDPVVTNSILWESGPALRIYSGNPSVSYSNVSGGYAGEGNLNLLPRFVNSSEGDLDLSSDSPCIDAGHPDDFDECRPPGLGAPRADMGASGGEFNCSWLPPCDLEVQLADTPLEVSRGEHVAFSASAVNHCDETLDLDQVIVDIVGPVESRVTLYAGPPVSVATEKSTVVNLRVPPMAPLGTYAVSVTIFREGRALSSDTFHVEVRD